MEKHHTVTLLGTGNAQATHCYNTCFTLQSKSGSILLVDAGGGNGILSQLEKAGIARESIEDIFVTHVHTDHLFGVIWMMRLALQRKNHLRIHSHKKVLALLTYICQQTMPAKTIAGIGSMVEMHEFHDGDTFNVGDIELQCFDIHSSKEPQFGFMATLDNGLRLTCLGDEPYCPQNERYARSADWLMSEAFCLYEDRDLFHPYEKNHSTALDAAQLAEDLQVGHLILYHTEDKTLATRKERYTAEAQSAFSGQVYVPNDLECIDLEND